MHPDVYKRPLLWCLAALILWLVCFHRPAPAKRDIFHAITSQTVTLTGRVVGFPVHKPKSQNVAVRVYSVNGKPAAGKVYARFADFDPQWQDTLELKGRLQPPYGIDLLGNFNWRAYLAKQQIFTEIKVSQSRVLRPAPRPLRWVRNLRADILRVFAQSFPPELASIAGGVLLGERGEISPKLYAAFQDSGAIHLLVASGGNVGFVTLLTLGACALLGVGRKKALFISLAVAGIYTIAAGADAPLVRAYFMAVCACIGYFLGRNSGVLQGLLVSCLLILCFQPASVFETGFQMSFLATLAIIICLNNYQLPGKWPGWLRFFAQIFLATLATQLVLLPIFTNVFYKVSVTGLVANMILVPWASLLMGLSFSYYVLCLLHAGFLLHTLTLWCLEGFKTAVEFFASFPLSAVPAAAWGAGSIIAFYAMLFWLFHWPRREFSRRIFWVCAAVAGLALAVQAWGSSAGKVFLLNEWNKNAALVQMPGGEVFIAGEGFKAEQLAAALYKMGVRKADAVLAFSAQPAQYDLAELSKTGQVIRPFEPGVWPGDEWSVGKVRVEVVWGIHQNRRGNRWINAGYSGTERDDVSYCLQEGEKKVCIGAGARFAETEGRQLSSQRNRTVKLKI